MDSLFQNLDSFITNHRILGVATIIGCTVGILALFFYFYDKCKKKKERKIKNEKENKREQLDIQRHQEIIEKIKSIHPQDVSESLKEEVRTAEKRIAEPITAEDFFLKAFAAHMDKN